MPASVSVAALCFAILSACGSCAAAAREPALSVALPSSSASASANGGSWQLVWSDEFEGLSLNLSNWSPSDSNPTVSEYDGHDARFIPEAIAVDGGFLRITTWLNETVLDGVVYNFSSGWIDGQNKRAFDVRAAPLRFEASMQMPDRLSIGSWPAFWLLPNDICWPVGGEVDIIEWYGGDNGHFQHSTPGEPSSMSSTYHMGFECGADISSYTRDSRWYPNTTDWSAPIIDFSAALHTFGVEVNATALRFYVDDMTSFTLPLSPLCATDPAFQWGNTSYAPFAPLYSIINTAVVPGTNTTWWRTHNATLLVDWVRVFQYLPTTAAVEI